MNGSKVCPKCGARIVYDYNEGRDSYYLRCERDYRCWNKHSNAEEVKMYPEYISKRDVAMAEKMREAVLDDEQDYFYWDE